MNKTNAVRPYARLFVLSAALILTLLRFTLAANAQEAIPTPTETTLPSNATVLVYSFSDMTLHAYTSAPETGVGNGTYIIESANGLVVIDTHFAPETSADFRAYIDSIGKPIDRLIVTHEHTDHISGLTNAFADLLPIAYAPAESITHIADEIGVTVPNAIVAGSEMIDGITYDFQLFVDAEAEEQVLIKLPDYGVIGMGDLLYTDFHAVLSRNFNNWLMILNDVQNMDAYALYLPGHGMPADAAGLQAAIDYLGAAQVIYADNATYEGFQNELIAAYPDYAGQFFFSLMEARLYPKEVAAPPANLIEVITVNLADGATAEAFLAANADVEAIVSHRDGFLARETAVSDDGQWRIAIHWESKADSDNSIATFGEVPNVDAFMANLDLDSMAVKQYEIRSSSSGETTFPGVGATEVITVRLQDGADVDGWLAANQSLEENHIYQQPGFIARELGVTEDGEWIIIIHWETAADSAASIAAFGEAPGVEEFMSFLDAETMALTVYDIQQAESSVDTSTLASNATVKVYDYGDMMLHAYTSAPETGVLNGTYVIESTNGLVVIDTHFAPETSADFRAYIDSIGKPIDRVIITHEHTDHISGLTNAFADLLPITYAPAESITLIEQEINVAVPNAIVEGSQVIDGITYDFALYTDAEAEEQVLIKLPGYGVIGMGDLLYNGLHGVLNREFDKWLMILNDVQGMEDYDLYLAGHGQPADAVELQAAIDYLETAQTIYDDNDSYEGFQNELIAAYPDYAGQFFFSLMEERLYPKEPTAVTLNFAPLREVRTLVIVVAALTIGVAGTWVARKS